MPIFVVTRKSDGAEIYRYDNDAPVEWVGMEFATHDHVEYVAPPEVIPAAVGPRRLTKLQFIGRMGDDFDTLFAASKTVLAVEKFMKMLDWATPDDDGTSVDLDDPRVIGALQAFEGAGLMASGRAAEILA